MQTKSWLHLFSITLLLALFPLKGWSAEAIDSVRIYGKASDYANTQLSIETLYDYISVQKKEIGSIQVNKAGQFYISLPLKQALKATIELGKTEGFLYLEPGKSYEIVLPPFQAKTDAERLNPFFQAEETLIGIKNENQNGLNGLIRDFDEAFNQKLADNLYKLFKKENSILADQLVADLEKQFPNNTTWFKNYKTLKYGQFYNVSYQRKKRKVINQFFANKPVDYTSPAYWELFNQVFKQYILTYSTNSKSNGFSAALVECNFDTLSYKLGQDTLFKNREFRELVLFRGVFDAFYDKKLSDETAFNFFKGAAENSSSNENKIIASLIYDKLTHLRPGTTAPGFVLLDFKGKEKSLEKYKGKFVYLNFFDTQNYACKKDLPMLEELSKTMKKDLIIVSIIVNGKFTDFEDFAKKNKISWECLHYGTTDRVIKDYDLVALPTYYLIDPDGKILLSPAPAPSENFQDITSKMFTDYRNQNIRKVKHKEKSIYDL